MRECSSKVKARCAKSHLYPQDNPLFLMWISYARYKHFSFKFFYRMLSSFLSLNPYSTGIDFRRHNMTSLQTSDSKVDIRVKNCMLAIDPQHRYSNEAEKGN